MREFLIPQAADLSMSERGVGQQSLQKNWEQLSLTDSVLLPTTVTLTTCRGEMNISQHQCTSRYLREFGVRQKGYHVHDQI